MGELFKRAVKYLVEGLMVAIAAYAIPQKQLKLDEKHHDLRMRQIDQQKRATIEAFAERQKEIRQTKLLTLWFYQVLTVIYQSHWRRFMKTRLMD